MKRPWNITNQPIYSLCTCDSIGNVNMNICTYVTPVNKQPKLYVVAIDYNTKTYENLREEGKACLQVLSRNNMQLVRVLGKKSGFKIDKNKHLVDKDLILNWQGYSVLKNACAALGLEKKHTVVELPDHALYLFKVIKNKTFSDVNVLSLQDLIENKIIL